MKFPTFYEALQDRGRQDKGASFEAAFRDVMKSYFLKVPLYETHFSEIILWDAWEHRRDMPDTGIDLVAKEKESGRYWAVQCKAYQREATLQKTDIDSFLALSSRGFGREKNIRFAERLIVTTAKGLSKNAWDTVHNQNPPCKVLCYEDFSAQKNIDWDPHKRLATNVQKAKELFPYQEEAISRVMEGFTKADKGKLIMACGTGKSLVSLRLVERMRASIVLYLVPSLALVSQIVRMYGEDKVASQRHRVVCSDRTIRTKKEATESEDLSLDELTIPSTSDPREVVRFLRGHASSGKEHTLLFSTYQSLDKVQEAFERTPDLPSFDLILCDEAHRTTGKKNEFFSRINDAGKIPRQKILYMTATPRIYTKRVKDNYQVDSMDDEAVYGREFFRYSFRRAIKEDKLCDYRVTILTLRAPEFTDQEKQKLYEKFYKSHGKNKQEIEQLIEEFDFLTYLYHKPAVRRSIYQFLTGADRLIVDRLPDEDASRHTIPDIKPKKEANTQAIRRVLNFTNTINQSKVFERSFYDEEKDKSVIGGLRVRHVDGEMSANKKTRYIEWLQREEADTPYKMLTNAQCLSEGVDIPNIDGLIFSRPKKSEIDVVQAVGRAIRKAAGKRYGYIIIPVILPGGVDPNEHLQTGAYERLWQVLKALRSHDENLAAEIDNLRYGGDLDKVKFYVDLDGDGAGTNAAASNKAKFIDLLGAGKIHAAILDKVGDRAYMDQWNANVNDLAGFFLEKIDSEMQTNDAFRKEFLNFYEDLLQTVSTVLTQDDLKKMLAQHLMTEPVFEMLFKNEDMLRHNAFHVSFGKVMEKVAHLKKERGKLETFYETIRTKLKSINNYQGRQNFLNDLYEKFFKSFSPSEAKEKGIVYTPQEVVQFMSRLSDWVLQKYLKINLEDKDVNIIDPFTGTGNFIVNVMRYLKEEKKISTERLQRKFEGELHANEISLLAYYIASVNIEATYKEFSYLPHRDGFTGLCLVDTFSTIDDKEESLIPQLLRENSLRIQKQKKLPLKVILTNPPYYVGKTDANQDTARNPHEHLDRRIQETYVKHSKSTNRNSLYDYYVKAFRWGTDRLAKHQEGLLCFITNNGFLKGNAFGGFRRCLLEDFDVVYHLDLKGNIRISGVEEKRKQGGNVFDIMTGVGITLCLRTGNKKEGTQGKLFLYRIDDFMKGKDKLQKLDNFKRLEDIPFEEITPQGNHWIDHEDRSFDAFIPLGSKENKAKDHEPKGSIFWKYSHGLKTNRDSWTIDTDQKQLETKMKAFLETYKEELERIKQIPLEARKEFFEKEITKDNHKIKWSDKTTKHFLKGESILYTEDKIEPILYRPFHQAWVYRDKRLNDRPGQMPFIYPTAKSENMGIECTGMGAGDFVVLSANRLVEVGLLGAGQYFPYWFWHAETEPLTGRTTLVKKENITNWALKLFRSRYGSDLSKWDVMYYVYAVLQHPDYMSRYKNNLFRHLPRVPLIKRTEDFLLLSSLGKELFALHMHYDRDALDETVSTAALETALTNDYGIDVKRTLFEGDTTTPNEELYLLQGKLLFSKPKSSPNEGSPSQKRMPLMLRFNAHITLEKIPNSVLNYKVSGLSPLEHLIYHYRPKDLKNGYRHDPNQIEGGGRYLYRLILCLIRLSLRTVKCKEKFPKMEGKTIPYGE